MDLMTESCEYCDTEDGPLYGWQADVWCAGCITDHTNRLTLAVPLELAPLGRPTWFADPARRTEAYATPFVIHPGRCQRTHEGKRCTKTREHMSPHSY